MSSRKGLGWFPGGGCYIRENFFGMTDGKNFIEKSKNPIK